MLWNSKPLTLAGEGKTVKILQLHVYVLWEASLPLVILMSSSSNWAYISGTNTQTQPTAYAPLSLRDGGRRNMLMRSSTPCSSKQYFLSCGEKKVEVISKVDHTKI